MAQKLFEDKIGTLSHNAGIISMGPSRLTIGGQQYVTTSTLQLVLPALTANQVYMLYAVQTAGIVSLVQSTSFNSVGPGTLSWKLVGAYIANGLTSVSFGSFLNIDGIPTSDTISGTPTLNGFGTPSGVEFFYTRMGKWMLCDFKFTTGTVTGAGANMILPANLLMDRNALTPASNNCFVGDVQNNSSVNRTALNTNFPTSFNALIFTTWSALGGGLNGNSSPFVSGQVQSGNFRVPIDGWSHTPLKDL